MPAAAPPAIFRKVRLPSLVLNALPFFIMVSPICGERLHAKNHLRLTCFNQRPDGTSLTGTSITVAEVLGERNTKCYVCQKNLAKIFRIDIQGAFDFYCLRNAEI
ncbi:hypothetical protein [Mesorhizobium sp. CO1-1-8]|uniref:hypothetical protein n=1 Tax=Mesorhizobium sp. CO1-1-8 TaxID=2876631 RepID=UPI001CD17B24|nr:hypothetical protein [Mesorhizobium sp. CO1-1-8]MBZ9772529.1 hypothetical protein [Mesorhizobium sp. CO1-1-8]